MRYRSAARAFQRALLNLKIFALPAFIASFAISLLILAKPAAADVERVEILERSLVADGKAFGNVGAYERIRGRLYFAVEAAAAENQVLVDIRLAPRDAQGRVTFAADFVLLKPLNATRGNGRLLYDVVNQGDLTALASFNDANPSNAPTSAAEAGNGFLMEQGYALLASGWSWDVAPGGGRLRADLPIAMEGGKPIYGRTDGEVTVLRTTPTARHVASGAIGYEPASSDDAGDVLTVRESAFGPRTPIARNRWHFGYEAAGSTMYDPALITLDGGFKPGAIYALTYTVRGPRVAGLGLAGIRDALMFFRGEKADKFGTPNPLIAGGGDLPKAVLAFGNEQGARLLQTMIYHGLTADGRGRMAFDGVFMQNGGAGRGGFNIRFAQAGRRMSPDVDLDFPTDVFPFATALQTDTVTNEASSVIDRASTTNTVPKLFYVNSAMDYWTRSASLLHTAVNGTVDVTPDRRARLYAVAGAAHTIARAGERDTLAHCRDPLDYRPLLRSLLLHLDGWVTLKKEPPESAVPTIADGTLVKLSQYSEKFPKVPGLRSPIRMLESPRLDFGPRFTNDGVADVMPPKVGKTFTVLVPATDDDGLDKGSIRLPEVSVPLGTYTGWNLLNAATGAPERLARDDGSFLPFEPDEDERVSAGDPRPSIKARYPTREAYTKAYAAAALTLAEKEMILGSDINGMIERAGAFYDRTAKRTSADESCAYLGK